MTRQFRRLDFDQIGFHVLDDSIADAVRQKIDNRGMNFGCRGERPTFFAAVVNNFRDLIGELLMNAAIGLGVQFALGNGGSMLNAGPVANRIASGQIAHLIDKSSMRVGDVKCLDEMQARSAGRCFIYTIGF